MVGGVGCATLDFGQDAGDVIHAPENTVVPCGLPAIREAKGRRRLRSRERSASEQAGDQDDCGLAEGSEVIEFGFDTEVAESVRRIRREPLP